MAIEIEGGGKAICDKSAGYPLPLLNTPNM